MKLLSAGSRCLFWAVALGWSWQTGAGLGAEASSSKQEASELRIVELQGTVEIARADGAWNPARTNQALRVRDHLRTATNSRAALKWSDNSVVPIGASTEIEILPPHSSGALRGLRLLRGVLSFFHRDQPGRIQVLTRGAAAGVEGTEFVLAVSGTGDAERTTLSVIDGRVRVSNSLATLVVTNGEQAIVDLGQAPVRSRGFVVNNVLQWCFYYPAVLDLVDLPLTSEEQIALDDSLAAYRAGDLLTALAKYSPTRSFPSESEQVYHAALLLSVGEIETAEEQLSSLPAGARLRRLVGALRQLIAAVKRVPGMEPDDPERATEFVARSYLEQSRAVGDDSLKAALGYARAAVARSPDFGFGWARVAELEFSFGRNRSATEAVKRSLALAPRNAQALALQGYLLAAENETPDARRWFDLALATDSALGNAWLGRGLCRIRLGDGEGGREDLLVAAALEPQRAELRSYLGKANGNAGDYVRATKELELAKKLDPNDPTAWLYSALLNHQQNRVNEAIRDLEKSQSLNDNRGLYRSRFLLDQDRAVRSANLANLYRDAGLSDVSLREAARAVTSDYGNYSGHLFLADSFQLSLDNQTSQRYETASATEYLLANLLAPVGAGTLSPTLSRSEYSRLFERHRVGIVSSTEYLSRGAWMESGAQYGTFDKWSYDFDWLHASDPGQQVNNDYELHRLQLQLKLQLTAQDGVYARVSRYESHFGDLAQYFDDDEANRDVRLRETQEPIVSLGYHHEWQPGVHTVLLATRIDDSYAFTNPAQPTLVTFRPDDQENPGGTVLTSVQGITMHEHLAVKAEIYSAELQQIWQTHSRGIVLGSRIQAGDFDAMNSQNLPSALASVFPDPPVAAAEQDVDSRLRRLTLYGYDQERVLDSLLLVGGMAFDRITFPENFRDAPIAESTTSVEEFSPKAGLVWTPDGQTTARFAYTRSIAGASLDQSYRIEPAQVAGFVQSFRSVIPESVVGANAGAAFETYDLSVERRFRSGTYLGIAGEMLNSDIDRVIGAFDVLPDQLDYAIPSGLRNKLKFRERSLLATANQLVGTHWAFGARYRLSESVLHSEFVDVPDGLQFYDFQPRQRLKSLLHEFALAAIFNHQSGVFFNGDARFYSQSNLGSRPDQSGGEFWQCNVMLGYRFPARKAELQVGLLNLFDQDYRLSPLNPHANLPRKRTLTLGFRLNF